MSDRRRIKLEEGPDGPTAECGCVYHYWDGKVRSSPVRGLRLRKKTVHMTGVVDPHIHLCEGHAKEQDGGTG